jgi:hypothetical protein
MAASEPFRVGVTRDFIRPNGELGFGGAGVRLLEQTPGIEVTFLPEHGKELRPEDIAGFDALGVLGPRVTNGWRWWRALAWGTTTWTSRLAPPTGFS